MNSDFASLMNLRWNLLEALGYEVTRLPTGIKDNK